VYDSEVTFIPLHESCAAFKAIPSVVHPFKVLFQIPFHSQTLSIFIEIVTMNFSEIYSNVSDFTNL